MAMGVSTKTAPETVASGAWHLWCAVGLGIPHRLHACRADSASPGKQSLAHSNRRAFKRTKGNDGNVASRTGPGGRCKDGLAERQPRDRRVVPVPGFGGSPVGEYRLWCFGLLSTGAEMCADTYRSLSQASRARPGPMRARASDS